MVKSPLKNKVLLIVDDYEVNTKLLSLFVSDAGAIPLTASNGKQCIEIVKQQHVDMILMDSNMPVMNGIDATRAIRALPQGKNIVIIGISGEEGIEESDLCLQAGMDLISAKLTLSDEKLIEMAIHFFGDPTDPPESLSTTNSLIKQPCTESNDFNIDQPVMDYEKALKEFENDNNLLISLIENFNGIIHSQLILMQQALGIFDLECIQRESHGIKGGAANLRALPLSIAANSLETACKQHAKKEIISELLVNLAFAMNSFDKFVKIKTENTPLLLNS
jgi:two-component system sensor histidine kinase/response regulator